jgi:hypothetical protein
VNPGVLVPWWLFWVYTSYCNIKRKMVDFTGLELIESYYKRNNNEKSMLNIDIGIVYFFASHNG